MKFLHTSDWHIGQVFKNLSRQKEHELFLLWLRETIVIEDVEVLLVSGDIFDVANPSSSALKTYYDFLKSLLDTSCKRIIITGGNHDGISTLDAPKDLLEVLNITIISGEKNFMEDKENLIIRIDDKEKNLSAIVCAVPFLRDSVVRKSISNQSSADIESQLKVGIKNYYQESLTLAKKISTEVPIIAMGHLTIMGGVESKSERDIYIGKLQSLNSTIFDGFDYVALGHLHRPQRVSSSDTIRYSGSPICLSFSEINHKKKVLILDITEKNIGIDEKNVPEFRKLYHLKGSLSNVILELNQISQKEENLSSFVEISIEGEFVTTDVVSSIFDEIKDLNIEVLQINSQNKEKENKTDMDIQNLDDITPFKAFETRYNEHIELLADEELRESVMDCFKEIMEKIDEDS